MKEHAIDLSAGTFRYLERSGKGLPLLFLHGLGDSADQLAPIAASLPDDWHLLALDQRGHGGSAKPDDGYTPGDFAADAVEFLETLGIESAHLFGHSMGGRNALVAAAGHPDRARSLILGDIGPEKNPDDIVATRSFFEDLPPTFATVDEARAHLRQRKPGYGDQLLDLLMRNLEPTPDGGLRWRYSTRACIGAVTAARSRDWWELLPRVRCPVLLVHADASTELAAEVAERMRRELADVRYIRIPDCGHNFHLESPERAAAEIQRFVLELE